MANNHLGEGAGATESERFADADSGEEYIQLTGMLQSKVQGQEDSSVFSGKPYSSVDIVIQF